MVFMFNTPSTLTDVYKVFPKEITSSTSTTTIASTKHYLLHTSYYTLITTTTTTTEHYLLHTTYLYYH